MKIIQGFGSRGFGLFGAQTKGHYGSGPSDSVDSRDPNGTGFLASGRRDLEENRGKEVKNGYWETWHFRENRDAPKG